jgi:hypothetical protein
MDIDMNYHSTPHLTDADTRRASDPATESTPAQQENA